MFSNFSIFDIVGIVLVTVVLVFTLRAFANYITLNINYSYQTVSLYNNNGEKIQSWTGDYSVSKHANCYILTDKNGTEIYIPTYTGYIAIEAN